MGVPDRHRNRDLGSVCPTVECVEQTDTTTDSLTALFVSVSRYRLKPSTRQLLFSLAVMPPIIRLARNLKVVIGLLCSKDIENVLVDGLAADERMALLEIDASAMPHDSRRTAHALFNMPARLKFIRVFGRLFKDLRTRSNHKLEDCNDGKD